MKKFIIVILSLLTIVSYPKNNQNIAFASSNSSEIVMELNTNRVVHEFNSNKKMFMASTTKILTAIVVIENIDLNKRITINKQTIGVEGSSIYLEEGEILSIKDLLYGLMLRSGNDCALTLACSLTGKVDDFIFLMNETAKKIGAKNSNFVNPHGLHDDNHYTTAYDLALISCYALKNDIFREIVSTRKIEIPWTTRNHNRVLINKNKMLKNYEGATGIKTGYTKKAGRCLVSSAKREGLEFVCVVLNCPSMWQKSAELLDNAFESYNNYKIYESDEIVDFYIDDKNNKVGIYIKEDLVIPLTKTEKNIVKTKINYDISKGEKIKKDSEIGEICIFVENNLIFKQKIFNIIDINY
ncbi:MAG: D-alanyl-D-alanine carboxypeptidase [Clostridia bacterium]|nr:D-alanyl-D-alanine carboxypeptidase [Clostridia bacterium]